MRNLSVKKTANFVLRPIEIWIFAFQTLVSCWKLALLVIKGYCQTAFFQYRTHEWTLVQSIKISGLHPRMPQSWRCSFAFFVFFFWHFSEKLLAVVIFKSSGLVLWNNQENGTEKQWNLHPHLTVRWKSCDLKKKTSADAVQCICKSGFNYQRKRVFTSKRSIFFLLPKTTGKRKRYGAWQCLGRETPTEKIGRTHSIAPSLTFCTISLSISNSLWCKIDERFL